ncbi:MAG: ABC transporter ATP-binding protein [Bacteroidetes bacterium]|nr:ABC transporter ATP-binding protein [Bacteroidota bacterium]MCH8033094.1 ABC transporter ATP-binding protein [Bacteroidota bacterium]
MIELSDIKFSYPNSEFHLSIDSLLIGTGEKTAVIGPSGFGKTTMLNLIAGILIPEYGSVIIKEKEINHLQDSERRNFRIKEIGFVFQDFKLLEYLNVLDNILLPFRINKSLSLTKEILENAQELAASINIEDKLYKHPSKLSHGERQRVAICRALLNKPSLILADEPTGNLDPANKAHIMDILFDYVDNYSSTLITVTHDYALLSGFDEVLDFEKLNIGI